MPCVAVPKFSAVKACLWKHMCNQRYDKRHYTFMQRPFEQLGSSHTSLLAPMLTLPLHLELMIAKQLQGQFNKSQLAVWLVKIRTGSCFEPSSAASTALDVCLHAHYTGTIAR